MPLRYKIKFPVTSSIAFSEFDSFLSLAGFSLSLFILYQIIYHPGCWKLFQQIINYGDKSYKVFTLSYIYIVMKKLLGIAILLVFGVGLAACNNNKKTDQLAKDEIYTCKMHQNVIGTEAGVCPKSGMQLVKQKITADQREMIKAETYIKPKE